MVYTVGQLYNFAICNQLELDYSSHKTFVQLICLEINQIQSRDSVFYKVYVYNNIIEYQCECHIVCHE